MKIIESLLKEMEKLKLTDIKLFNLEKKSIIADYFLLGSADNSTQLEACRNKFIDAFWKKEIPLKNPQEEWEGGWLAMDFGNVIIHVFLNEMRSFYNLDDILSNAETQEEMIEVLKSVRKRKKAVSN